MDEDPVGGGCMELKMGLLQCTENTMICNMWWLLSWCSTWFTLHSEDLSNFILFHSSLKESVQLSNGDGLPKLQNFLSVTPPPHTCLTTC